MDRNRGEKLLLADPAYARRVRDALLYGDRERGYYDLHAWVILHNHIHALLDPHTGTVRISETIMDASELSSARRFWERESWERGVRTRAQYLECLSYIHNHPAQENGAESPAVQEWSSANSDALVRPYEPADFQYPFVSGCQQAALRL